MNLDHFGMDTITLAGPLEAKLRAVREARFTQIMLSAQDLVGHPGGEAAAVAAVHASGLRVTGFQVLRDFEGLDGHLHAYKVDVAKAMLEMCRALRSRILLVCSSASAHATGDFGRLVKDLQKLAMLAVPLDIRIAYEALSWGRHVNEYPQAWEIVQSAARENLGLALDSFHILANRTPLGEVDHRPRGAPQPAGTPAGVAFLTWWSNRRRTASSRPGRWRARSCSWRSSRPAWSSPRDTRSARACRRRSCRPA